MTQEDFRARLRAFVDAEIVPRLPSWEERGRFPLEILGPLGALGAMGMLVASEYGGGGRSTLAYAGALEELARGCAGISVPVGVHNGMAALAIQRWGSAEQRERYLPDLAAGRRLGAWAMTESEAGSDAANVQTLAERQGDSYRLRGCKHFVTSAAIADPIIVLAQCAPAQRTRGMALFAVEKGTPGLKVGPPLPTMGLAPATTHDVELEDCRVPATSRIGEEGAGFRLAMQLLETGRLGVAAQAVGIAQAALEAAIVYARSRRQFGQAIAAFQGVQWLVADMVVAVDAARLLVEQAARRRDAGEPAGIAAAKAKLFAAEAAVEVTRKAVQVHGGAGYLKTYPVERYYRDAKLMEIVQGTSEIQRMLIAREALNI